MESNASYKDVPFTTTCAELWASPGAGLTASPSPTASLASA